MVADLRSFFIANSFPLDFSRTTRTSPKAPRPTIVSGSKSSTDMWCRCRREYAFSFFACDSRASRFCSSLRFSDWSCSSSDCSLHIC